MFMSCIVVKTQPVFMKQVANKLNEFEGVVHETQILPEKAVIVARIVTDNHRRFKDFLTQEVMPIQGIRQVEESNWPKEHWSGNFGYLQGLRGNILQTSALTDDDFKL